MNKANTAFEAVSGILGGPGVVIGEEYQEAMRALDSFNQIALTRALGSIAGRENKELQERKDLAALQGIQLEYARLADAYTRKIEGDTADVSSRLDEFFN